MHGGKRKGAGRPPGVANRPTIFTYWDTEAIKEYFEFLRDNYKEDSRLMVFVGEHIMGKASQQIDLTSGGKPLLIGLADEG